MIDFLGVLNFFQAMSTSLSKRSIFCLERVKTPFMRSLLSSIRAKTAAMSCNLSKTKSFSENDKNLTLLSGKGLPFRPCGFAVDPRRVPKNPWPSWPRIFLVRLGQYSSHGGNDFPPLGFDIFFGHEKQRPVLSLQEKLFLIFEAKFLDASSNTLVRAFLRSLSRPRLKVIDPRQSVGNLAE